MSLSHLLVGSNFAQYGISYRDFIHVTCDAKEWIGCSENVLDIWKLHSSATTARIICVDIEQYVNVSYRGLSKLGQRGISAKGSFRGDAITPP